MSPPALELLNIRKHFGQITALDDVTLRLAHGSVHGLLGENGAGKSTLMNIAYGLLRPDSGQIRLPSPPESRTACFRSPRDAIAAGIGMVHQHFMLAGAMTVLDNVLLGDGRAPQFLNRRAAAQRLIALAGKVGLLIDPQARVEALSVGQQQRVEILKALWRDARILILDEPTAVLTPAEAAQLFTAVERLRDQGTTIVFISHKLGEVRRICDRLTVLRRGRVAWEGDAAEISTDELARHMIGRDVQSLAAREDRDSSAAAAAAERPPVLELRQVGAAGLEEASLCIGAGEMLGIAGVDGNGQQALAEVVAGLRPVQRGGVRFAQVDVTGLSLKRRIELGLAHIPNDRKREALVPSMSIAQNMLLKLHDRRPYARWGIRLPAAARRTAVGLIARFDIRPDSPDAPAAALSGGNQQKVVLARELATIEPRIIIAMNPTRGLDLAAARFVHDQLLARRDAGSAVLLISSELDEVLALCDRVGVLYNGSLTLTDFPRTTRDQIGRLMAGAGN